MDNDQVGKSGCVVLTGLTKNVKEALNMRANVKSKERIYSHSSYINTLNLRQVNEICIKLNL